MIKKITASLFALAIVASALPGTFRLGSPQVALAQTTTINANLQSIQNLLQQIQALQTQLNALQLQRQQLVKQTTSVILTTLREGSQGDAVSVLPALLAA